MDKFAQFIKDRYTFVHFRRNTETMWYSSDQEEVFFKTTEDGIENQFDKTDITYKFNSHGFRCDEFTEESEFPIVFIGCSMTEGVGLPIHLTWPYHLVQYFRKVTGKKIPLWNLAIAGTGAMTQANLLYHFKKYIKKPVLVFGFVPPPVRMEFTYGPLEEAVMDNPWMRGMIPGSFAITDDVHFQQSLFEKQLHLLDAIAEQGSTTYYAGWGHDDDDYALVKNCPNLNLTFPIHYKTKIVYGREINNMDKSRDLWHPGPRYNKSLAKEMWKLAKHHA